MKITSTPPRLKGREDCCVQTSAERPDVISSLVKSSSKKKELVMEMAIVQGKVGMDYFYNIQKKSSDSSTCVKEYNKEENVKQYSAAITDIEFKAHMYCADMLSAVVPNKDALILDLCAGTGAVGEQLLKKGYLNVHAHDGAMNMLALCKRKEIYKDHVCCFLNKGLKMPISDDFYDAMTISGATCLNHLPPGVQQELIRVIKPGGYLINTYRTAVLDLPYGKAWQEEADRLEREQQWHLYGRLLLKKYNLKDHGSVDIYRVA